jgi:hypothetical protein
MAQVDQKKDGDAERALESFGRIRDSLVTIVDRTALSGDLRWSLPQLDERTLADVGIAPRASASGAGGRAPAKPADPASQQSRTPPHQRSESGPRES